MGLVKGVGESHIHDIDGLLWGVKWNVPTLTYAFPTSLKYYADYPAGAISGFEAFNQQQRAAVSDILKDIASITNLDIEFSANAATANLRFSEATAVKLDGFKGQGTINTAIGLPPDITEVPKYAIGDSFYNPKFFNEPVVGSYAYHALMHEIGHTLGLKHGHLPQRSPDGSVKFPALFLRHDTMEYSVMTYRSFFRDSIEDSYNNEQFGFAQSLMMLDIAALQHLYGADYTYRASNTVYSWNPRTGEMSVNGDGQGKPGANRVFLTIWDGGGEDTYDMSNYGRESVKINLEPGQFSVMSRVQLARLDSKRNLVAQGNVYNAMLSDNDIRSLIENAIGSQGNNRITGNFINNELLGPGGDDDIYGGNGDDHIDGSSGLDKIEGGKGNDLLQGGGDADDIQGNEGQDDIWGGGGSDVLSGDDDNDWSSGGRQSDTMDGGLGDDSVYGGGQSDTIEGGRGDDSVYGGGGNDDLTGGSGKNLVSGGKGADILRGGRGTDAFSGGSGTDTVTYGFAVTAALDLSLEGKGFARGDTFNGVENLVGSFAFDILIGDAKSNSLDGGQGNDTLAGQKGNDKLIGSYNADILSGGEGSDKFAYGYFLDGGDTITDFSSEAGNNDLFQFTGSGFGGIKAGSLRSAQFQISNDADAQTSAVRFIFEKDTGILSFDGDGNGRLNAYIIATLQAGATMTINDIEII